MKYYGATKRWAWVAGGTLTAVVGAHAQTLPPVPAASPPVPEASAPAGRAAAGVAPTPVATASAPSTYIVPSVAVLATQSSNANFGTGASARSDTVLQLVPRVFFQSRHARWSAQGDLSANSIDYVSGVQPSLITPEGHASLHSEWSRNLLYFDAAFSAVQQTASPFLGQGGALQGSSYTSTQWRISPYIERRLRPGLQLLARSDDTWTYTTNTPAIGGIAGGRYLDQHILLQQAPSPMGYGLDLRQTYATYDSEPYAWLRDSTLQGIAGVALTPRLVTSLIVGRERVQAYAAQQDVTLYGGRLQWHPTPTGSVDVRVEHRYFGTAWRLDAVGGGPRSRLSLHWSRSVDSALAPLGSNATASSNLTTLLNGVLVTQVPDPLQRARLVQQLLGESGLPAGLQTSGGYYTTSSVVRNDLVVTAMVLRLRDSFAVSLYRNRDEDLFLPGQDLLRLIQTTSNNNLQTGVAASYAHRLTPLDNLSVTLQQENDSGFGLNQGQSARQRSVIAQLDHRLSPRTIALVGVRRRLLTSTVVLSGTETAVFAGFVHRF